jgi:hypothetical protein
LLKSRRRGWWWIDILIVLPIVVPIVVVVVVIPCIGHLKYNMDKIKNTQENDSRGKGIVENPKR